VNYGPASKYYDLFASKDDIEFYKELAVNHGRKALELGVGTGRVAIELAKAGVTVLGIDNSEYMLNVARQKLKKQKTAVRNRLRLQLGDMQNFRLKEKFPLVYIPASTFEHCITDETQRRCLKSAYNVLGKQGLLAFDISQPQKKQERSWWIDHKQVNPEKEAVRIIFSGRNLKTDIVTVNLFFEVYRKGKMMERYNECGKARISSKKNVEKMLEDIGFEMNEIYGGFDKCAYNEKSEKIVFVALKPQHTR